MSEPEKIKIHVSVRFHRATLEEIRNVWMIVSESPSIPVRAIARKTKTTITRTHYMLKFLEQARYIKRIKGKTGRKVVIPLVEL